ncbi:MAG TPA: fructose-bisphosphate aldolase [Phycisphaerales bacterium]|nr:fructose-bisphosphate aldolase [Phycisphaerales bacterium]HCD34702.1 fructose-bisphosphate aldolase [Phycisphaerales bacterium]|tara:strand:- start:555 stop:1583 length:1029 start_codon:yes stop_codon:yes gene_type:complete
MLMTSKPMFDLAYDGGFGIGAFNVNNMEITQGIIEACAAEKSPCILQISKGARSYANMRFLNKIIEACVEEYPEVPICVHLDHGDTVELVQKCIDDKFTSVMIDGSHHEYEENVALSKAATDLAHANGVVVEAELGMLGGIEEDVVGLDAAEYEKNVEQFLTDPDQAADFAKRTGIDSLAVAIGTSHGAFKFTTEAKLAFDRVEQIMKTCPGLPLVMHGSSSVPQEFIDLINKYGGNMPNAKGVPEDQIAMAVRKYGVCKVNIDTDLRLALTAKIREVFATQPAEFDPRKYLAPGREAIVSMVKRKLAMLNSAGKADEVIAKWEADGKVMPAAFNKTACCGG